MARPHIECLDTTTLPWQLTTLAGIGGAARQKLMSEDTSNGATTLLLQLPAFWRMQQSGYRTASEELFVLSGELLISEQTLSVGCYSYLPPGARRQWMTSSGCLLLLMIDGRPDFVASCSPFEETMHPEALPCLDTTTLPWQVPASGSAVGISFKPLRTDPHTGEETFLAGAVPLWEDCQAEIHPTVEEAFCLHGEVLLGERGIMRAGGYFWRPPQVWHGPLVTRTGGLWFFRTKGGSLSIDHAPHPGWEQLRQTYLTSAPLYDIRS